MGGQDAETFPINVTTKGRGERLGWLQVGKGVGVESLVGVFFAASLHPGGKDLVEKDKLRIR